jgi:hypothetical protein
MSAMAEKAREKAKAKVSRLTTDPHQKVDASSWTPPEPMNTESKTGMRPISRRQFKRGGKISGEKAAMHAGRKPRKSGGSALTADSFVNRDAKEANQERDGFKFIGGMKKGGRAKCGGGPVAKKGGGSLSLDGSYQGMRPAGGRLARAKGGRAKKGMNVNIIIAPGGGGPKPMMPPPGGPPPGGPVGLHQGAPPPAMPPPGAAPPMGPPPMGRKSGGRTNSGKSYPIDSGAGGGLGRLEKARAYG